MYKHLRRGFSLAELGIALVILLIVSTIAVVSYFSIIDNAKEVKIIEDTETLQLVLARQEIDVRDYSTEYNFGDLDQQIQSILEYHLNKGTNLRGLVFPNEVILDDKGYYVLGELKVKKSEIDNSTAFISDLLNIKKVKAEVNNSLNLKVRKLDNNKMNKLVQENLDGDWFVVSSYVSSNNNESNEDNDNNEGEVIVPNAGFTNNIVKLTEEEALAQGYTPIYTVEDLNNIRNNLIGNYILMNDIDLGVSSYSVGEGWEPIGNNTGNITSSTGTFKGTLNGNGYVIKNLYINRPELNNVGLFGKTFKANVYNLGIEDANVTGNNYVGIIIGNAINSGSIGVDNVYVSGNVNGIDYIGGLIGYLNALTIKDSNASISVNGNNFVGGLIGRTFSNSRNNDIVNSYSLGNVSGVDAVGGIVGQKINTKLLDSYSKAFILSTGKKSGGLVGDAFEGNSITYNEISNSYFDGSIEGNISVGGIIGENEDNNIYDSYSKGTVKGIDNVGGIAGHWHSGDLENSFSTSTVIGNKNVGGISGYNYWSTRFSNNYYEGDVYGEENVGGLIGYFVNGASAGHINKSYVFANVIGNENVGGFVGYIYNNKLITESYSSGTVQGDINVGGFVGKNRDGYITNSYSTSKVTGKENTGGFVGEIYTSTRLFNNYSIGHVIGETDVGGFVGNSSTLAVVKSSYWDKTSSELTSSASGTGKNSEEMKSKETFEEWDFDTIWFIDEENNYPRLQWENK